MKREKREILERMKLTALKLAELCQDKDVSEKSEALIKAIDITLLETAKI